MPLMRLSFACSPFFRFLIPRGGQGGSHLPRGSQPVSPQVSPDPQGAQHLNWVSEDSKKNMGDSCLPWTPVSAWDETHTHPEIWRGNRIITRVRGERVVDLTLFSVPSLEASNVNCLHIGRITRMQKAVYIYWHVYTFLCFWVEIPEIAFFFFLVNLNRKFYCIEWSQ